jgi:hypothetical protein
MKTQLRLLSWVAVCLAGVARAVAQYDDPNKDGETIVTIYATDSEASEGTANTGTLTVIRRGDTSFPLAVFYEIGGGASNGVDYQTIGSMVEIPVGASQASFTIAPINDDLIEGIERMGARLVPSPLDCLTCGYEISYPGGADVTIYDNDFSRTNRVPPIVNVFADDDAGREIPEVPAGSDRPQEFDPAVFTVVRTGPTSEPLTVSYFIGGTASNGTDYERVPGDLTTSTRGTVTIPAGAYSANIEIAVIDDALVEGSETVNLWFIHADCSQADPGCYTVGPQTTATAQILDNESEPTNQPPFVSLDVPHEGQVFYSAPTNIYLQAFAQDREDSYFVDVEFFEGTRSLGMGTFNPTRCWPGCPNYILTWSNVPPGHYVLTAVATDHRGAKGTSAPVRITVLDVRPMGAVNIFVTDPVATETPLMSAIPPDPGRFTVRRDDGTNDGIVVFYEISGTASNGTDYQPLSGHVTLPAGVSSAEIVVAPIDDLIAEGTESVVVTLIPQCPQCWFSFPPCLIPQRVGDTNCFPLGPHRSAVVLLRDNEELKELPVVNLVARDPIASEGARFWWLNAHEQSTGFDLANWWDVNRGGTNTATFVVRRHGPTNVPLAVDYTISGNASNGVDYALLSGSVTIGAGRRTSRIVVVPIDDSLMEGIESVRLTLKSSDDYRIGFPPRAGAIIVDNDRPRPTCRIISDGDFHLCRPATNGFSFRIEASTNLIHWTAVCTNVVTDGALHFVDPDASALSSRFYRIAAEPPLPPDD